MKNFLLLMLCFFTTMAFSQSVKGVVIDADSGDALIGASVSFQGTTIGTITDIDGGFEMSSDMLRNIVVSYVGYETKTVSLNGRTGSVDLGNIEMLTGGVGLEEVVITGTMDIVKDRRTPVAVSTISASEIQAKAVGNVELPEVAKATPSVFVANQAGGYGDSEVWTRGFDQTNTAFLLNGQPINGMEDGKMYWSNWSGLTDVANAVQIQRGLGASKLAISSVGGTWNFIMKATENEKGGNVFSSIGNNNFQKVGASYSTGLINDKFGMTVLLSNWSGDGWANGAQGQGQTYFLSAGYKPAENHSINFLITGAPQWHNQKYSASIDNQINAEGDINPRYNGNWGIYDGDIFSERRNYYHKPVINLNWDWDIDEYSSFSTVLYGSFGRGGGTGNLSGSRVRTESGLINFDAMAADEENTYIRRSSVNNHNWFGAVLKYERDINENINVSVGSDLRRYFGDHFRQVSNLFGKGGYEQGSTARYSNGYTSNTEYSPNPWSAISNYAEKGDRIAYNNGETIQYAGGFAQVEYSKDKLSAYVQGAVSTQNHVRHEYFYASEADEDSEKVVNAGYNVKAGLSYSFDNNNTVFVNSGIYSRQPFHDVVFVGNSNVVNEATSNEEIIGLEIGYKYNSRNLTANINGYYTAWNGRIDQSFLEITEDGTTTLSNNEVYTALGDPYELLFQDQLHMGIELDLGYRISDQFRLKGFGSVGKWDVIGKRDVELYDGVDANNLVSKYSTDGEDVKVGGAPQTSFGLGARYDWTTKFSTEANYFHYADLYARSGGIKLPSYGLLDLNFSYAIPFENGNVLRLGANIYNVLDELYISKSFSSNEASATESENWNGINKSNSVTFGKTRTWNFSMKYSF